jgi:D-alanine-D-alanine ligase
LEEGGDADAEYDAPETIAAIRQAIESHGHEVIELEATPELPSILPVSGVDVVFNIAEGLVGRTRESQVPALLELLEIPYTGSDPTTLSLALDKALAKRLVSQAGFRTPPYVTMSSGKERLPRDLTFPVIVKPLAEGSSKGIVRKSVVENETELREVVQEITSKYRQEVIAESYLPGREFTVALLGEKRPRVLPPMEVVFTDKSHRYSLYSYESKFFENNVHFQVPAEIDRPLLNELEKVARGVFSALGCRDLARVDLRLDEAGQVSFIECNPIPGLTPGFSDFCVIAEAAGMTYRALIGEILAPALRRLRELNKEKRVEGRI